MESLTSVDSLTMPERIGGSLFLLELTSANGLTLPERIGGNLNLESLTSAENQTLPKIIGGEVYLIGLKTLEGLVIPEDFKGEIIVRYELKEELKALISRSQNKNEDTKDNVNPSASNNFSFQGNAPDNTGALPDEERKKRSAR